MVDPKDVHHKARVLSRMLHRKMGARGDTLAARRRQVGRRLPRNIRRAVLEVERAAGLVQHPKIGLQLDPRVIETAFQDAYAHLDKLDPFDRTKGYVLDVLAVNAFNFLTIGGAVLGCALWFGWV